MGKQVQEGQGWWRGEKVGGRWEEGKGRWKGLRGEEGVGSGCGEGVG